MGAAKTSWLKQIGSDLLKGLKVFAKVGSFLLPVAGATLETMFPAAAPEIGFLEQATKVVVDAEAFGQVTGANGAQKLAAATPQVQQLILDSAAFAGKKISDPAAFSKACTAITSAIADAWNSVEAQPAKS